jgi:hypothetical protein
MVCVYPRPVTSRSERVVPWSELANARVQGTTPEGEVDAAATGTTRATARLPGLDIEIMHRRAVEGHAEQISINLRAVPSFEAFGRALEAANPFAFWAQAAQLAWLPWLETLALARELTPSLPRPSGDTTAVQRRGPARRIKRAGREA